MSFLEQEDKVFADPTIETKYDRDTKVPACFACYYQKRGKWSIIFSIGIVFLTVMTFIFFMNLYEDLKSSSFTFFLILIIFFTIIVLFFNGIRLIVKAKKNKVVKEQ